MKRPRQSTVEKIQAKAAAAAAPAAPPFGRAELQNLIFAARHGLTKLSPQDLVNVSVSIAAGEALLAFEQQQAQAKQGQPAPANPATPPAPPAEPAKG